MDSDINYIIRMSLNGDKNNQEILLERLKPLIYKNIYQHWDTSDNIVEDLVQEGYIVILESLKSFDKNRNVHFLYYVKMNILYFYKNYYRSTRSERNELELLDNINSNHINDVDEFLTLDFLTQKETNDELLRGIGSLSPREQIIINSFYFKQIPMIDICKNLKLPYSTAMGIKQKALKKLGKLLSAGGE